MKTEKIYFGLVQPKVYFSVKNAILLGYFLTLLPGHTAKKFVNKRRSVNRPLRWNSAVFRQTTFMSLLSRFSLAFQATASFSNCAAYNNNNSIIRSLNIERKSQVNLLGCRGAVDQWLQRPSKVPVWCNSTDKRGFETPRGIGGRK